MRLRTLAPRGRRLDLLAVRDVPCGSWSWNGAMPDDELTLELTGPRKAKRPRKATAPEDLSPTVRIELAFQVSPAW